MIFDKVVHSAGERGKKPMQITGTQWSGREPYYAAYVLSFLFVSDIIRQ
jgi:hypothetical protein